MSHHDDPSLLLETLSDRVLRSLSPAVWRKLFLRPHQEVMEFEPGRGTLLCAAVQVPAWGMAAGVLSEVAYLAACHGGELDPCPEATALVRFEDAESALEMALELQHLACDARFQVGLVSGACTVASLKLEGGPLRVLLGDAVERAGAVARLASPGTIRIAPETFSQLQRALVDFGRGVLTTEFEGDAMTAVSLTLTPKSNSQLSSFAGLGLT